MSITIDPRARQIELDESDAERHAYTVSVLDENGHWIDTLEVFGNNKKADKAARKLARETGLPLVIRTVHPAFS